jgi:hypothetical protein
MSFKEEAIALAVQWKNGEKELVCIAAENDQSLVNAIAAKLMGVDAEELKGMCEQKDLPISNDDLKKFG